jgi:hypothetical protein
MEFSPWAALSVFALITAICWILYKQRAERLGPLKLLTEDAFANPQGYADPQGVDAVIETAAKEIIAFPADGLETTYPTARNPFMNVLPSDMPRNVYSEVHEQSEEYNPDRPAAAPVSDPMVKQELDDYFRTNFYNDPTDVFGKSQSQREFIVMPSTTIPNDRESLQNWLYKMYPEPCKAGGRAACYPGTDGGPITSLNQNY